MSRRPPTTRRPRPVESGGAIRRARTRGPVAEPAAAETSPALVRAKGESAASEALWDLVENTGLPPPAELSPPPRRAAVPPPVAHDATGWNWFTQWPFPSQFFIFALVLAGGTLWLRWHEKPSPPIPPRPVKQAPAPPRTARLSPETFVWLNRLRETAVVTEQLEQQFADAQRFYRENSLDDFLDYDPWTLPLDQVACLGHLCDHRLFTVEREILLRLLENRLLRPESTATTPGLGAAAQRLAMAVQDREERMRDLRDALAVYQRGRGTEVVSPVQPLPEQEQALRAEVVGKLAAARRECAALDARIAEAQAGLQ